MLAALIAIVAVHRFNEVAAGISGSVLTNHKGYFIDALN